MIRVAPILSWAGVYMIATECMIAAAAPPSAYQLLRVSRSGGENTIQAEHITPSAVVLDLKGGDSSPRLTLEPDRDCYTVGETVTVAVWMRDIQQTIVGGQFFLRYDKFKLDFLSVTVGDDPFTTEVFSTVNEPAGTIDYAVGLPEGSSGTSADTRMAIITFESLSQLCSAQDLVAFRTHNPPSRLGDDQNQPVYPTLVNLSILDDTPPTATQGEIDACYASPAEAEAAALAATTELADNCADPSDLTKQATSTGGCSAVVTVTVTDTCGNSTEYYYYTRIDTVAPTATPGTINSCYANAAEAEAAAIAATGNPVDDCSLPQDIVLTAETAGDCAAVVTVTVTDECGNFTEYEYNTRIDGTPPTAAQGVIDECYDTLEEAETAASAATTDLSDDCFDAGELTKDVSSSGLCPAAITVTITDPCGNFTDYVYYARIDTEAPTATPGTINSCYTTVAAAEADALAAMIDLADDCSAPQDLVMTAATFGDCDAVVTVTVTDECGNFSEYQYNTSIDSEPPTATQGVIADCYASVALAEADALAATTDLLDDCTNSANLILTANSTGTCSAVVTVRVLDECGNYTDYNYPTRIDEELPVVTPPADVYVHADAGLCTALLDPGQATALDNCTTLLTVIGTRDDELELTDSYPQGTTTITWETVDECGNRGSAQQQIHVSEFNEMLVDVELKAVDQTILTRCITFELFHCATSTTQTIEQEITFTNGTATGVSILVDCGIYDCIRARDGLHTLWRTDLDGFGINGPSYVADFTDQSGIGGTNDALIGGNLFDDVPPYGPPQFIDIMDYTVFVNAWAANYGSGDTDCDTPWPHADVSGDGAVGTADFTFIQTYFLVFDDPPCCGAAVSGVAPRTRISTVELRQMGLSELAIADLNQDGWVDTLDIAAFADGVRPQVPNPLEPATGQRDSRHGGLNGTPAMEELADWP